MKYDPVTMSEFKAGMKDAKKIADRNIFFWCVVTGLSLGMVFNAYQRKGVLLGFDSSDDARKAMAKQMGVPIID